jgi:hypothetical protein
MKHSLEIERINNLVNSGYASIEKGTGRIVDRRENKDALPFPSNKMLNVPEPKELATCQFCGVVTHPFSLCEDCDEQITFTPSVEELFKVDD